MKEKDINFKVDDYIFNLRAVAIIIHDNKILFQKRKQDKFWALPGGKAKVGETTEETIKRELKEEIGIEKCSIEKMHSVSEYFFKFEKNKYHQYIFAYIVKIKNRKPLKTQNFNGIEEDQNLVFKWFDINNLKTAPIKPEFLKDNLINLNKTNETIFVSHKEKSLK